jgi:hypothetical protein
VQSSAATAICTKLHFVGILDDAFWGNMMALNPNISVKTQSVLQKCVKIGFAAAG